MIEDSQKVSAQPKSEMKRRTPGSESFVGELKAANSLFIEPGSDVIEHLFR